MALRVLIVEDEPLVREGLVAFLEDEGLEPTGVGAGELAVELVRGGLAFDVCVMDMRLPGINGHQTILELSRLQPSLRFVVHTGSVDYQLPPEIVEVGVDQGCVLPKPVEDLMKLVRLIQRLGQG